MNHLSYLTSCISYIMSYVNCSKASVIYCMCKTMVNFPKALQELY